MDMEEDYQILADGEPDKYILVRKKRPGYMAYLRYIDKNAEITKINLMENCDPASLSEALNELDHYIAGDEFSEKMKELRK